MFFLIFFESTITYLPTRFVIPRLLKYMFFVFTFIFTLLTIKLFITKFIIISFIFVMLFNIFFYVTLRTLLHMVCIIKLLHHFVLKTFMIVVTVTAERFTFYFFIFWYTQYMIMHFLSIRTKYTFITTLPVFINLNNYMLLWLHFLFT